MFTIIPAAEMTAQNIATLESNNKWEKIIEYNLLEFEPFKTMCQRTLLALITDKIPAATRRNVKEFAYNAAETLGSFNFPGWLDTSYYRPIIWKARYNWVVAQLGAYGYTFSPMTNDGSFKVFW